MREIAEQLISSVEGLSSEENIKGVMQVFEGIKTGMNNMWEDHLYSNANEVLFFSKTSCPVCFEPLKITRTRSAVLVGKQ